MADKETKAVKKPGFREDGTAHKGVDPDTGERKAVTLDGLKEEFGDDKGALLYRDIAIAGGYFNPDAESANYRPSLDLTGLKSKQKTDVEAVLAGALKER